MIGKTAFKQLKGRLVELKKHTLTVYYAARDPRTPIVVRLLALLIAAYALSPIDLIPDFIPVIGYIDDLLLIPLGLALVARLTPAEVWESAKLQAEDSHKRPVSYAAACFVLIVWILCVWLITKWLLADTTHSQ